MGFHEEEKKITGAKRLGVGRPRLCRGRVIEERPQTRDLAPSQKGSRLWPLFDHACRRRRLSNPSPPWSFMPSMLNGPS